jgi:predicted RND superfamily exporter protein
LIDLGWLSAVCLFLCLIASLTLLPALLSLFDQRVDQAGSPA